MERGVVRPLEGAQHPEGGVQRRRKGGGRRGSPAESEGRWRAQLSSGEGGEEAVRLSMEEAGEGRGGKVRRRRRQKRGGVAQFAGGGGK